MNYLRKSKFTASGFVLLLAIVLGAATNNPQAQSPSEPITRQETENTLLENLPKPLKIFREKSGNFFSLTPNGEKITLPAKGKINPDAESNIFFDKYGERIFFYQNKRLHYYDLKQEQVKQLPRTIGSTSSFKIPQGSTSPSDSQLDCLIWTKCVEVAGVYHDYIVLRQTRDAGTGNMTVFNLKTGQKLPQEARVLSSEYTQSFELFLNGKNYQLILDSKTQASVPHWTNFWSGSPSVVNTSQPLLSFYLQEKRFKDNPSSDIHYNPENPSLRNIVFGIGPAPALKQQLPILELQTKQPEKVNSLNYERAFHIRTLFQVETNKVAIEVDNGLVIIDLSQKQARHTESEPQIEQLMKEAIPLAPPINNNFDPYIEGYCDNQIRFSQVDVATDTQFVFCLE